jgi:hypothetical protein
MNRSRMIKQRKRTNKIYKFVFAEAASRDDENTREYNREIRRHDGAELGRIRNFVEFC